MASELSFLIRVSVDGVGDLGVFDKKTGGDASSTPVKHRAGGQGTETVYPVLPTYSDITVSRVYELQRDHALIGQLRALSGRVMATVTEQPLDGELHAWGPPRIYRGELGSVKGGDVDSTSNNPRMFEIDVVVVSSAN